MGGVVADGRDRSVKSSRTRKKRGFWPRFFGNDIYNESRERLVYMVMLNLRMRNIRPRHRDNDVRQSLQEVQPC